MKFTNSLAQSFDLRRLASQTTEIHSELSSSAEAPRRTGVMRFLSTSSRGRLVSQTAEIHPVPSSSAAAEAAEERTPEEAVLEMFRTFRVRDCSCHSNDIRDKLLSIIEAGCGTLNDFDKLVRAIKISFISQEERLTKS